MPQNRPCGAVWTAVGIVPAYFLLSRDRQGGEWPSLHNPRCSDKIMGNPSHHKKIVPRLLPPKVVDGKSTRAGRRMRKWDKPLDRLGQQT